MVLANHSKAVNIAKNVILFLICVVCYLLIVVLFVSPQSLLIRSLIFPEVGRIKPAVVVALLAAVITGATSALITRCVEQSLWLKLAPRDVKNRITVGESHRLAEWSVSPLARLFYLMYGRSWLLRFGGILLVTTVLVSPVLVSGISQRESTHRMIASRPRNVPDFTGFLDDANGAYNGGGFQDIPMTVAALAYLNNLTAPAAPTCTDPSCMVKAQAAAIRADCRASVLDNPDGLGETRLGESDILRESFCSGINPEICRDLVRASPATFANFTTGWAPGCDLTSCPGEWGTLFGVWVNDGATSLGPFPINMVDCALTYGNVTIRQDGGANPKLDRQSFQKSTSVLSQYPIGEWHRLYTEVTSDTGAPSSPYGFSGVVTGTGGNSLYKSPVGWLLLGRDANDSASIVGRKIEDIFDMSALFAFSRAPTACSLTIENKIGPQEWVYNPNVLAILLVPFVATVLGVWGRWRVSNDDIYVGYNPVEIARRGPVLGLEENGRPFDPKTEKVREVWGFKEDTPGGGGEARGRFRLTTDAL